MVRKMNLSNDNLTKKITKKFNKIFLSIIVICTIIFGGFISYFMINLTPTDKNNDTEVLFTIASGWSQRKTAQELKNAGLIKNDIIFILYSKMTNKNTYLAGEYSLKKSMNVDEILDSINKGDNLYIDVINVTFVEGKRFTYYAGLIEEKFGISKDSVIEKCKNKEYLQTLIDKYWFLTDDILNTNIYYPLEGYLYPDTYEFHSKSSIETIIGKMLDATEKRLDPYKEKIVTSGMSVHSLLTIASVVELEAVTSDDRVIVAGLFNNRLNKNMGLESDVTTYYAEQKQLSEKLYMSEINRCNAYNTRGTCVKGLPVGPICSPSYTSIIAAIEPGNTEYLFFVADTHNKLYYATTLEEHNNNIAYLKQNNLWPE